MYTVWIFLYIHQAIGADQLPLSTLENWMEHCMNLIQSKRPFSVQLSP